MKKLVFVLFLFVLAGSFVFGAEGVDPGSYKVGYDNGLSRDFDFDFVLDGKGLTGVSGELASYVTLDKEFIWDRERVVAHLELPEGMSNVGVSNIKIYAGDVVGLIVVNFSYPDVYAEAELLAPNVNEGEDINVKLNVLNKGIVDLDVSPFIEIYHEGGVVDNFDLEEGRVNVTDNLEYSFVLSGENYSAGDYLVFATVDYGAGVAFSDNEFRVGEFKVGLYR